MKPLHSIEEILADIAAGRMVVIMDDEDRENEGDLVMAAQKVRAEDINFMARFGRGLICLTLTAERCRQLAIIASSSWFILDTMTMVPDRNRQGWRG
jgi:3,4-dihydroxy 2-butanone 4-phosphate synthase/GTP cyclohydrolase II